MTLQSVDQLDSVLLQFQDGDLPRIIPNKGVFGLTVVFDASAGRIAHVTAKTATTLRTMELEVPEGCLVKKLVKQYVTRSRMLI